MIQNPSQASEQNDWQEFKPLFGGGKIKICVTLRAVTPFGGLSVLLEFFARIGLVEQLENRQPESPNHYDPGQILVGFMLSVIAGAHRFAHAKSRLYQINEWQAIDAIYSVSEFGFKLWNWKSRRRFVVVREEVQSNKAAVGRKLIDLPGYVFRVFVTSRSDSALEIWRDYNGRAAVECRIDELKNELAADHFCLRSFFATERRSRRWPGSPPYFAFAAEVATFGVKIASDCHCISTV